jgi:predicted phosphodiesterase
MKIAFFSDTHGTLSDTVSNYDFSGVELCVFCGDCYESDFKELEHLSIPKI